MSAIMDTDKDKFQWVEWMVKERKKKGWSQADLSRAAGVTRTTISDYEKRIRTKPDIEILWRISVALDYPDDYLPRMAGLLPPQKGADPWAETMTNLFSQLAAGSRGYVEDTISAILRREKSEQEESKVNSKTRAATQTKK